MSIVDLAKARAYADATGDETARDWIRELADAVESLERALAASRATSQAALSEGVRLAAERDEFERGLRELYDSVVAMLNKARALTEHHPHPVAAGAALAILKEAGE